MFLLSPKAAGSATYTLYYEVDLPVSVNGESAPQGATVKTGDSITWGGAGATKVIRYKAAIEDETPLKQVTANQPYVVETVEGATVLDVSRH